GDVIVAQLQAAFGIYGLWWILAIGWTVCSLIALNTTVSRSTVLLGKALRDIFQMAAQPRGGQEVKKKGDRGAGAVRAEKEAVPREPEQNAILEQWSDLSEAEPNDDPQGMEETHGYQPVPS